jgi:hypothetical protein
VDDFVAGVDEAVGSVVVCPIVGEGLDGDCPPSDVVVSLASPAPDTSHHNNTVPVTTRASKTARRVQ